MNVVKNLFQSWRAVRSKAVLMSMLVLVLLVTSVPWVPGMNIPTASASTNLRISPSEINTDLGEKTVISFSFSAADSGKAEHEVNINLCTPGTNGGPPKLGQLIASGKYRTKNAQGEYIVHEVEWDGKIGGVPLPEGKYYIAVSPADYNGIGVYYGQIGSFEIVNGTRPKPPASIMLEAGASGSTVVKGTAEAGATVSLEMRDASGKLVDSQTGIAVNGQGQWSKAVNLPAGQLLQIAARSHRGGQDSSYSEIKEVLRYTVPGFPVTWRALAGYYYKADSSASVHAKAQEIAAWNGLGPVKEDDNVSGSSILLINPQTAGQITQADLAQFTAEAIQKRLRIVNPSWSGVVEPARGDFAYSTDVLELQELMPLSFGLSYLSRDPYTGASGLGWHHSYEWRLTPIDGKQELMQPDGARFEFVPLAGGKYLTPAGTDWILEQNGSGHVLKTPQGLSYQFDGNGQLASIRDLNGNEIALTYQNELLQSVTTDRASLTLSYNGSGQLESVTDHTGRKLGYGYDGAGDLVSFTDVDGSVTKFGYDGNHHVVSVTDPAQTAVMSVTYDPHQRVTSLTDFYGATETAEYSGKVAPVVREEEEPQQPTGPVSIDPNNGRDIPESDIVILSGTMHNLRNAPPYKIVEGLKPAITSYLDGLTAGIQNKADAFEAAAGSGTAGDIDAVKKKISAASGGSGPVIVRAGQLNVEESVTFGSSSKPVILIADGINTNQDITVTIYGTLILKQGLNANTKLKLNAYQVGGAYGNIWATGTIHLNNDSAVKVDDTLYAGVLTYNSGQLTVDAQTVIVRGDLSINTKVIMNIAKEMTLGGIVSNNQLADLNIPGGDLFVRDNVHVNNQMSVVAGGVFAIGGDMVPNQTPKVRVGVGSGKTILTYPETPSMVTADGMSRAKAATASTATATSAGVSAALLTVGETKRTDALGHATTYVWGDRFLLSDLRLPDGSNWQYEYDAGHRLAAVTDGNGYKTTANYDFRGNKVLVADGNRQSTVIRYNDLNLPVEVADPLGQAVKYTYDASGNMTAEEDALGHRVEIDRDNRGVPTQVTDKRGKTTRYTLDAAGFVESVTDPSGYVLEIERDELHRVTSTRDSEGTIEEVIYDAKDRLQSSKDALQQRAEWTYDHNGNLLTYKDEAGSETSYGYEVYRMASVTNPLGHLSENVYDATGNVVEESDGNGGVNRYEYDGMGRVAKMTDADGNSTAYTYDGNGNVAAITDAEGNTTEYTYNPLGQVLTIKDELGAVKQYKYDAAGRLIKETDALGNSTWYNYDAAGRMIEKTDALGYITQYAYDAAGNRVETTLPDGSTWTTQYDERGLESGTVDPLSRATSAVRDGRGRLTSYTDAEGNATSYEYDALDRTTLIRNALGYETRYTYNALGQVAELTDAKGQTTKFSYDALGRLTEVTDAAGGTSSYTYDALGNLLTKTNPLGAVTSYSYNKRGLVESTVNPLQEATSMTYDGNGSVKSVIAPDHTTTQYEYDRRNRLTEIRYGDGQQVTFGYDLANRRLTMDDATGQTRYNYDALGRLTEMIDPRGRNVRYEWTTTGQRSRIIYPDNTSVVYDYDKAGQITQVTDGQGQKTGYGYNLNGQITSRTLPGGETSSYQYDPLGQLVGIEHRNAGGQLLEQLKYVYDPAGNITRKERQEQGKDEDRPQDEPKPADIEDYTYDALNRLIEVQNRNGSTVSYTYDAAGNRLKKTQTVQGVPQVESYTYDLANKLTRWEKGTDFKDYTYDLRGNLLQVEGVDSAAAMMRLASKSVQQDVYGNGDTDPLLPADITGKPDVLDTVNPLADALVDPFAGGETNRGDLNPDGTSPVHPNQADSYPKLLDLTPIDPASIDPSLVDPTQADSTEMDPAPLEPDQSGVTDQVYGPDVFDPMTAAALAGPGVLETYTWDAANRLIGHINPAGDQSAYRYDGDNNRVYMGISVGTGSRQDRYPSGHPAGSRGGWEPQFKKQQSEVYFTYDLTSPWPEPLYATDTSGTKWEQSYVYGAAGERLSMSYLPSADGKTDWEPTPGASGAAPNTAPETLYYLNDMLGSPLALLNRSGEVALRYHYDEFGTPKEPEKFDLNYPGPDNLFGYTGLGYDAAGGLSFARARYFNPSLGRFVSQDTYEGDINNPQTLNLYTYVENNPLIYTDPSGHFKFEPYHVQELKLLLAEAREKSNFSKKNENYQLYKDFIWNRYNFESYMDENQYSYLYGLLTGTSAYKNSAGNADWAKEQLASAFFDSKVAEYSAALGMGLAGGMATRGMVQSSPVKSTPGKNNLRGKTPKAPAKSGCNCFVGGTKVLTDEGEKPIEEIEVGDKVLAKDDVTGEQAYKVVTALHRNEKDTTYKLSVGSQIIETTDNHPFWVDGKGWVLAVDLKVGDELVQSNEKHLKIDNIEIVHHDEKVKVYNFTVVDFHTYFVSDLGIWVHNIGGCDFADVSKYKKWTGVGSQKDWLKEQRFKEGRQYKTDILKTDVFDRDGNKVGEIHYFQKDVIDPNKYVPSHFHYIDPKTGKTTSEHYYFD
ncbi:polymorphic toxin-type HINT domain-containing protein [Paenibacillus faecis]|nr:polymorphic toxin-type HINT domain-containing protein [Paenibacillus faecis]